MIKIPGARTFRWNKNLTLGAPANFIKPEDIDGDYIVLNADRIADSTILGFGHHCGTGEVTFFHDLPLKFVETVDSGKGALPVSKLDPPIMKQEGLKMDERIPLLKYLRR